MRTHLDTRTRIFDEDPPRPGTCLWEIRTGRFTATECGAPTETLFCSTHDNPDLPGYTQQHENAADWAPADPFTDD